MSLYWTLSSCKLWSEKHTLSISELGTLQVLMVIFDILASHHRMLLWHESSVENLLKETADLQRARQQAESQAAESNSQAEQDGLEDAQELQEEAQELQEEADKLIDGPATPSKYLDTAPAEGLHGANLPLDRRYEPFNKCPHPESETRFSASSSYYAELTIPLMRWHSCYEVQTLGVFQRKHYQGWTLPCCQKWYDISQASQVL